MSQEPKLYAGHYEAPEGARFAIVSSRFNHFVVDRLEEGAVDGFVRHGVSEDQITRVHVPGAWELPLVCKRLAKSGKFAGIVALGAVIRGATAHFDFVAGQAASGCASAMSETGVPVILGVITTETIEQAIERSGTKAGNKGFEAALVALELANLDKQLAGDGL